MAVGVIEAGVYSLVECRTAVGPHGGLVVVACEGGYAAHVAERLADDTVAHQVD